jgi:hypothetical protein
MVKQKRGPWAPNPILSILANIPKVQEDRDKRTTDTLRDAEITDFQIQRFKFSASNLVLQI